MGVLVRESACPEKATSSAAASPLPELESSSPKRGASDVPRTAWLRLTFSDPVTEGAASHVRLACDGLTPGYEVNVVGTSTLVVNPCGLLPQASSCRLEWTGASGPESVAFQVAGEGAPAAVLYDRNDTTRLDPFPDDYYLVADPTTRTGERVDVRTPDVDPVVKNILVAGTDGVKKLDGMSPLGHVVVALPSTVDSRSIPLTAEASLDPLASVGLFDIDPASPEHGKRVPFDALLRDEPNKDESEDHTLIAFPTVPLRPRGRYAFVVSNRALVSSERPLGASPFFDKVLSGKAETADETRLERPLARVLKELARTSPPWRADDLALAIGISIRSVDDIPNDLLAIREELQKLDPPVFELTSTEAYSGPGSDIAAIVRGTFSPPSFRDGNYLRRDEKGRPVAEGTETIGFTLAVPKGAQLEKAPIIMYQHGQPGKSETQVANYANRGLARAGFAVIGFTDVVNREIIPDGDVVKLNTDALLAFLNTHDMPDYLELLTNAEQLAFLRVLPQLDQLDVLPLDSPDGVPDLDPSKPLGYLGVSQGSVHGIGFLSFAPEIRAAALVTGAGRLAATLIHQAFEPLYGGIAGVAPKLTRTQLYAGLALVQMVYDRQDSQNLARYLRREPLELGSERRASVLMTEGLDDPLIPPCATRSGAWQLGLPQLAPQALRVPSLRLAEAPLVANIDEHTTSAFFQYVPAGSQQATPSPGCVEIGEKDGHDCAQVAAEAIRQRVEFFVTGLTGAPRIIDPTPPE